MSQLFDDEEGLVLADGTREDEANRRCQHQRGDDTIDGPHDRAEIEARAKLPAGSTA